MAICSSPSVRPDDLCAREIWSNNDVWFTSYIITDFASLGSLSQGKQAIVEWQCSRSSMERSVWQGTSPPANNQGCSPCVWGSQPGSESPNPGQAFRELQCWLTSSLQPHQKPSATPAQLHHLQFSALQILRGKMLPALSHYIFVSCVTQE